MNTPEEIGSRSSAAVPWGRDSATRLALDVAFALTRGADLRSTLQACADAVVEHVGGAFARIWRLAADEPVLELEASAGMYTHIDGAHARVPVGALKIGRIAEERRAHLTNDVAHDPRVGDPEWAAREGMVAFAGYPLLSGDRVVGVLALFARHELDPSVLDALAGIAESIGTGIARWTAHEELGRLLARERRAVERTARLQAATAAFSEARTREEVADAAIAQGCEAVGARAGVVLVFGVDGHTPDVVRARGYEADRIERITRSIVGGEGPAGEALRTGDLVFAESRDAITERYGEGFVDDSDEALAWAPLIVERTAVGALGLGFAEKRAMIDLDRALVRALAQQCAQALDRARLYDATAAQLAQLKQTEQALMASERQFRTLAEAIPALAWYADPAGRIEWCNRRWYEYTGALFDQPPLDWRSVHGSSERARVSASWEHAVETGEDWEEVFRLRRHDGAYRWFLSRAHPLRDAEGRILRWFGMTSDIDDQKRAAQAQSFLAEASVQLASTVELEQTLAIVARLAVPKIASSCAVHVVDEDGTIRQIAVAHAHGGEDLGFPTLDVAPAIAERCPQLLPGTGAIRSGMIVPLVSHDRAVGALTFISDESEPAFQESDLALAEEIARRTAVAIENARLYDEVRTLNASLERRVEERTDALLEANRELEAFSYTVSHDLRAPVRHIGGFIDLLETSLGPEIDARSRRHIETVRGAARQMSKLIDALLSFSRMGRSEITLSPVDLDALFRDVVQAATCRQWTTSPSADEEPEIEWTIGSLPRVRGDAAMLRLVAVNLIDNALKYSRGRSPRRIEIGTLADGRDDEATMFVKDNGVGFDMAYQSKLFGVFSRLHGDDQFEGTGIGLATVRRIVSRHGGRTWAEGEPDRGATIYFTLPLQDGIAERSERLPNPAPEAETSRRAWTS